jgi:hypothetical protein
MRKPRDFDAELKVLTDKAKTLKERKVRQLGELVIATGTDSLDMETLAGALLATVETSEAARKEGWRKRGAAFFRRQSNKPVAPHARDAQDASQGRGDAEPGQPQSSAS